MEGSFEVEVSKEKAIKNTTTIKNENASVKYERLTNKIEKVLQTPMQTIIKTSSLLEDATERNSTYLLAEDYIGHLEYKIYDQNNNELFLYTCISKFEYYYEDGTVKEIPISEIGEFEVHGYNAICQDEYIVTEKNKDIKSLRIEVYEINEYYGTTRNIGTHFINLEKEQITCANKNEIVKIDENATVNHDNRHSVSTQDIEYFDIEINEQYDMAYYYLNYEKILKEDKWELIYQDNVNEENATIINYYVSVWGDSNKTFCIMLFIDKSLFDIYYEEENAKYSPADIIAIDENDNYKIAIRIDNEDIEIQDIKYITDTIKLKEDTENTESDYIVLYNRHKIDKGIGTYYWRNDDSKIDNTKVYYNYGNGKYIGKTTGVNLEENVLPIISISKKYEAIPRKYETINTIPEKLNFLSKDDVINAEINKIDLDGDGKEEYICCYAKEYKTGDYSDMYEYELLKSHIEIFDSNFNKIGSLIHLESDSDVYLSLEEDVEYIDIDNDGVMEILINIPGWLKWSGLEVFKYNNNQISGNVDSYNYASYRHGA